MHLSLLIENLTLKPIVLIDGNRTVKGGFVGDLLSYVMGNASEGDLWFTIQTHPNVIAVATLKDLAGVIICGGRSPEEETIQRAKEVGVNLLTTEEQIFPISGRLYQLLNNEWFTP
ncbi:MAG: serine kinase [bacterium]